MISPKGIENYDMRLLLGDIAAVVRHFGEKKAIIVGHDWGGAMAWQFAMHLPEVTEKLARYIEAFRHSDFEAMLNYYKRNYPRQPTASESSPVIKVQAPVLMFHGLQAQYLLAPALNGTWDWVAKDLTLVTIPDASHWVHHDAGDLVTRTMKMWLSR